MRRTIIGGLVATLAACATHYGEITPIGRNQYMITARREPTGPMGYGDTVKEALTKGMKFCVDKHQKLAVESLKNEGTMQTYSQTTLTFYCTGNPPPLRDAGLPNTQ